MVKYKKIPKYNVISIRITDREREILTQESLITNRSISDLMREALNKIVPPSACRYDSYDRGGMIV